jgi:endonuclease/exonuclease/phosphatase family metal-dependent hydrolase
MKSHEYWGAIFPPRAVSSGACPFPAIAPNDNETPMDYEQSGNPGTGPRHWTRRIWPLPVLLVLVVIGCGWYRVASGPDQGSDFHGTVRRDSHRPATLRVATFNIHGGKGLDGVLDLERTARCLQDVDLAGLSEVHGAWLNPENQQAAVLGRHLGLAWLFAPAERRWWYDHFGNAVLTSLPVVYWQRIPLVGRQQGSHRNLVWVRLVYGERIINVLSTHIDRQRYRQEQLRAAVNLFLALAPPAVLLGDLNSNEQEPIIKELLATPGVHDPVGACLGTATPSRIDWVFTRGLRGVQAQVCSNGASDHPCMVTELEIVQD